jgi:Uma2 family endonuclease
MSALMTTVPKDRGHNEGTGDATAGGAMSTPAHAGPVRLRMSYDEYRALSPDLRAEWVDGEVVMTPSPSWRHQQAARRVANVLEAALPGLHVVEAVTVVLPGGRERIPDVTVVAALPTGEHVEEVPLIAVEVLSPSNRAEDTVRKSTEYLAAGVTQYWLIDPEERILDIFVRAEGGWAPLARLDPAAPTATVEVRGQGSVPLRLEELLREE